MWLGTPVMCGKAEKGCLVRRVLHVTGGKGDGPRESKKVEQAGFELTGAEGGGTSSMSDCGAPRPMGLRMPHLNLGQVGGARLDLRHVFLCRAQAENVRAGHVVEEPWSSKDSAGWWLGWARQGERCLLHVALHGAARGQQRDAPVVAAAKAQTVPLTANLLTRAMSGLPMKSDWEGGGTGRREGSTGALRRLVQEQRRRAPLIRSGVVPV